MLQKINSKQKSCSIAICIYDNLHACSSNWTREIVINLSDFLINTALKNGFDVIIGDCETELLAESTDYSHAVMIATGTSLRLSERLFAAIREKCTEQFYLAGHVLDRGDSFYELHHQFYIVNMEQHKELDLPEVGSACAEAFSHREPYSVTNDGYISQKLCPGNSVREYRAKMHGWHILSVALEHSKTIIDLGEQIRHNKKYFYHEYDHVFLRESRDLNYNQFLFNNIVVPFNSDSLHDTGDFSGSVEQLVTTGTGLNWVLNLHQLDFNEDTGIHFADANPLVLQFMKAMIEQWDGTDYVDFWLENTPDMPNSLPYNFEQFVESARQQWQAFLTDNPDWLSQWQAVRNLSVEYHAIDYMSCYDLGFINDNLITVINVSDVFNHVPNIHSLSMKYRIAAFNNFITKINNINPDMYVLLTGDPVSELSQTTVTGFVQARDIGCIGIEKLIHPYWHAEDWKVLRPLV